MYINSLPFYHLLITVLFPKLHYKFHFLKQNIYGGVQLSYGFEPFKTMWRVRVNIIRLWKLYSCAGGLTIDMVLIDSSISLLFLSCLCFGNSKPLTVSWRIKTYTILFCFVQGDKIQASVKKDLVNLFDPFLAEGKTLTFTNFFKNVCWAQWCSRKSMF